MRNWTDRRPRSKAAHDELGAILNDIRRFGKTTPNDRTRLRALACTFGWSECSVDSHLVMDMNAEEEHQDAQALRALAGSALRPFEVRRASGTSRSILDYRLASGATQRKSPVAGIWFLPLILESCWQCHTVRQGPSREEPAGVDTGTAQPYTRCTISSAAGHKR